MNAADRTQEEDPEPHPRTQHHPTTLISGWGENPRLDLQSRELTHGCGFKLLSDLSHSKRNLAAGTGKASLALHSMVKGVTGPAQVQRE